MPRPNGSAYEGGRAHKSGEADLRERFFAWMIPLLICAVSISPVLVSLLPHTDGWTAAALTSGTPLIIASLLALYRVMYDP